MLLECFYWWLWKNDKNVNFNFVNFYFLCALFNKHATALTKENERLTFIPINLFKRLKTKPVWHWSRHSEQKKPARWSNRKSIEISRESRENREDKAQPEPTKCNDVRENSVPLTEWPYEEAVRTEKTKGKKSFRHPALSCEIVQCSSDKLRARVKYQGYESPIRAGTGCVTVVHTHNRPPDGWSRLTNPLIAEDLQQSELSSLSAGHPTTGCQ